jgi:hypothetical protein
LPRQSTRIPNANTATNTTTNTTSTDPTSARARLYCGRRFSLTLFIGFSAHWLVPPLGQRDARERFGDCVVQLAAE